MTSTKLVTIVRYILAILLTVNLSSCFYSRIALTEKEKVLTEHFKALTAVVLYSDTGLIDTVDCVRGSSYKSGFESNLDIWLANIRDGFESGHQSVKTFLYSKLFVSRKNVAQGSSLDLWLNMYLYKTNSKKGLILWTPEFEGEIMLEETINDTIAFVQRKAEKCPTMRCVSKFFWSPKTGIIKIVQEDGTSWKPR